MLHRPSWQSPGLFGQHRKQNAEEGHYPWVMVGLAGLVRFFRWLWGLFGTFLNLRDAKEILASLSVGLVGDLFVQVFDAVRGLPDPVYYLLVLLTPFVVASVFARLAFRRKPGPAVPTGAPSATATNHSSAASAGRDAASANAPGAGAAALSGVFHGTVVVNTGIMVKPDEGEQTPPKDSPPESNAAEARALWLSALASWRNVGVARRNSIIALSGVDTEGKPPEWRANVIYTAWLIKVTEFIRTLPVNGTHEAHAFKTLDRFSMDAAPAGTYANELVRWITAMFSTHLERLEELRKRYTRTD